MNRFGVRCYRYLAAKSEEDHYKKELKREQDEIIAVPDIGFHLIIYLSDKFSAETVVLYSFIFDACETFYIIDHFPEVFFIIIDTK